MAGTSVAMLTSWSPDKKHSDKERWVCIYPAYINKKKTLAEGRRIPKEKCVENPSHQEMRNVLTVGGFNVAVENKMYCRERSKELQNRGRLRVQLRNDDGTLCNSEFPTRESIMLHLGDMIPKLKTRQPKTEPQQAQSAKGKGKGKGRR